MEVADEQNLTAAIAKDKGTLGTSTVQVAASTAAALHEKLALPTLAAAPSAAAPSKHGLVLRSISSTSASSSVSGGSSGRGARQLPGAAAAAAGAGAAAAAAAAQNVPQDSSWLLAGMSGALSWGRF